MALEVISEKLDSQEVKNFIRGKEKTDELLNELFIKLQSLNNVYDDAEDKQLTKPAVRKWLSDFTEAIFDAEDLLDKIKTGSGSEILNRRKPEAADGSGSSTSTKVQHLILPSYPAFYESVDTKIEQIMKSLDRIEQRKDVLLLKTGARQRFSYTLPSTSLVEASSVYGRDEVKDTILKLLLANDPLPWVCDSHDSDATGNKLDVIPIVGMGGIGKTTLAQLIYNDEKVTRHFDIRAWVCVSNVFDVVKITRTICMSILSRAECDDLTDLNKLQEKLKDTLTGKKFLFVLDDVWSENYDYWDSLRRPFQSGAWGSKIIVTARNEGVASVMGTLPTHSLRDISHEDCWLLFKKHAFENKKVSAYPNLEVIGRKIVEKCKGLPLAAKSLGGLLRTLSNEEDWKNVLESDIWKNVECDVLPALWLSYHYLPPHLKRCFAYSSIYPKDYHLTENDLVLLWMAEDLLQPKKKKMVEEVGEEYFNDLISRSFFQRSEDYKGDPCFIMHDLINDLAKFVSGDFCVRLEDNDSFNIEHKTRHFSYKEYVNLDLEKFEALYEAKCVRTFLPLDGCGGEAKIFEKVLPDLFLKLQCLRVLNLSGYDIRELPDSVSNLIHLRYLDLSHTKIEKLPDGVCSLYNLQTLLLTHCEALHQLPTGLGSLIHLRLVNFRGTKLAKMPSEMWKLKHLQMLPFGKFDLYKETNIVDLKELQELQGTLHISGLDNIAHAGDALGANMREKKYLTELVLKWGEEEESDSVDYPDDSQTDEEVSDSVDYPDDSQTDEEVSNIVDYTDDSGTDEEESDSVDYPDDSRTDEEVSNIVDHTDDSRKDEEVLDNLRPHTNIRHITIDSYRGTNLPAWLGDDRFSNLVSVRLANCANCLSLPALPTLEDLELSSCPNVVSFPDGGLHAPNLRFITITNYGKLRSLWPEEMRTLLPSLTRIRIHNCPELESFPEGGLPCKLEELLISDCEKLFETRMQWGLLQLTSLRKLIIDFEQCEEEIDSFPEEGLLPTTLTELHFRGLSNLKTINSKELKRLISLQSLTIHDCPELLCLPDDSLPISLSHLTISGCPLVTQRCKEDKGEDWPKIAHIPFKNID